METCAQRELLPKRRWRYSYEPANEFVPHDRIVVGCYVKGPKRTLSYEVFHISDLPNDFVSAEDLEAIRVNLLDISAFQSFEELPDYRVSAHTVVPDLV